MGTGAMGIGAIATGAIGRGGGGGSTAATEGKSSAPKGLTLPPEGGPAAKMSSMDPTWDSEAPARGEEKGQSNHPPTVCGKGARRLGRSSDNKLKTGSFPISWRGRGLRHALLLLPANESSPMGAAGASAPPSKNISSAMGSGPVSR